MNKPTQNPDDQELSRLDEPKVRQCLRCQAKFTSQWAGERICTSCKSSSAWRSGVPMRASSTGSRR